MQHVTHLVKSPHLMSRVESIAILREELLVPP
jgi:hypothetical protein